MIRFSVLLLLLATCSLAHVGSPDVFFEGKAGPYPLSVSIRPPTVIPGIAEVEIRSTVPGIRSVNVVPYPLVGIGSKHPPTPDIATRSSVDPKSFTSSVWLMAFGSYQVRIDVEGVSGHGTLAVPIPAVATETKRMQTGLGWILALIMAFIVVGAVSIVGAAARESTLPEGMRPGPAQLRRSRLAKTASIAVLVSVLGLGNWWWNVEASGYRDHVYQPSPMQAAVEGNTLVLNSNFYRLLPDHGHLMHLFVVRMPEMDLMWHLHPDLASDSQFRGALPAMPAGHYKIFADIVRSSGFPETPIADINLPQPLPGGPLYADDAQGSSPPLSQFNPQRDQFALRDGYRMLRSTAGELKAKQMQHFAFEVQDASGTPATDLEPYLGMSAHAELLNADGSVFAHIHPSGTVPMAALSLTANVNPHAGHLMHIPAQLAFPYGFPKPGRYRMFIQIQRESHPESAAFDFTVK